MSTVNLTVDGIKVEVPRGTTILDAARKIGVSIPTLCHQPDLGSPGVCRVCVVEVEGQRTLQAACAYPASEGMVVRTNTPLVREARRAAVELLLAHHPDDCLKCIRNGSCELQALAQTLGIREVRFEREVRGLPTDDSNPSIVREPDKCVNCRRCVEACEEVQTVAALHPAGRGFDAVVLPAYGLPLADVACTLCGQCVLACPTGAIHEKDETDKVWEAISDPKKHVVVQTAPAIRASLGEEMGLAPGSVVTGQMVAALRRLGFDRVFDTDFAADLTIVEEVYELHERIVGGGTLPMITSCSPGWIKFIEHFYPGLLGHVSTCKSPQQMFGALAKTYYAERAGIPAEDIFVVSIMPCTAKKFEARRPEMNSSGFADVDVALTTRELGRMLRQAGIAFEDLEPEDFDAPLGISTGAGAIFGATGGVMEAALRTAYEVLTGGELESPEFTDVRGLAGVKEAQVKAGGLVIKVAVAHGLGNARKVLDLMREGKADWQFIEVMSCPGGCVGGGGQPFATVNAKRAQRGQALYEVDGNMKLRKSHTNPAVAELYEQFLGHPLSETAHHLLHTHYTPRERY